MTAWSAAHANWSEPEYRMGQDGTGVDWCAAANDQDESTCTQEWIERETSNPNEQCTMSFTPSGCETLPGGDTVTDPYAQSQCNINCVILGSLSFGGGDNPAWSARHADQYWCSALCSNGSEGFAAGDVQAQVCAEAIAEAGGNNCTCKCLNTNLLP